MRIILYTSVVYLLLLIPLEGLAKKYTVNSQNSFEAAHNAASPGDTIVWEEGLYYNIDLIISKSNLVINAEIPGKTVFTGASKVHFAGNNNTFSSFQYLKGNIGTDNVIHVTGSHNHLTQLNIQDYYCYKYVVISEESQYTTLSYCNLENRTFVGDKNILSILVSEQQPGYHTISYCSFKNFEGSALGGDAGVEPIRFGLSTQGDYISRSTVEYCYFTQCNGDGEIISHKSRQNVYRYNTFENNPYGELVLRHGDEGIVYGNFFLNGMGGIRIKEGQDHAVFNNYFSELTNRPLILMNYNVDPLDRILIAYNTFINSENIRLGASGAYPPANVTFANNIFAMPTDNLFDNPTGTETWIGNISSGSPGIELPAGIREADPGLELNSQGFYELSATSTAIDSAQEGYPQIANYPGMEIDYNVNMDLMQQQRPSEIPMKDIGCSEYSQETSIIPHVTEENTGPSYLHDQHYVILQISNNGQGSVSIDPPSGVYGFGTEVTLTATPGKWEVFDQWEGDLSGNSNPSALLMDGNKKVTAYYESLRPVVTGLEITVNNEDGFTVASSSKPGYVYIIKYSIGSYLQTKRELDSLVNINEGKSAEAPDPGVSVALYTNGLPGGFYNYYAVDEDDRISFAGENWLRIEETGAVTSDNYNLPEKSLSVYHDRGQIIVDPGTKDYYALQIFTITAKMLYSNRDLIGKQYFNVEKYPGVLIIRKLSGQKAETVRVSAYQ